MIRAKSTGFVAVMLSGLVFGAGCCKEEKAEIQRLHNEQQELMAQRKQLNSQLDDCRSRQADLLSELDSAEAELARTKAELKSAKAGGESAEGWTRTAVGDRITVGGDILFSSGKASLTSAGKRTLNQIAADLKSTYSNLPVRVYGHTDSDPIKRTKHLWDDNLDLSANRAMAVTRYLRSRGLDADRIETIAMGQTNPVAGNSSRKGKAQNRRVEIVVIRKKQ